MPNSQSGFQPVGESVVAYKNAWFSVVEQPMDFLSEDGRVKKSAADGGQMNYVQMGRPGSLIAAVDGNARDGSIYLIQQERYPANVTLNQVRKDWELPGGGLDEASMEPPTAEDWLRGARAELLEEAGLIADEDDFALVGPTEGHFPHPSMTDRNALVVVRGVKRAVEGTGPEDNEIITGSGFFQWDQAHTMYMGGLAIGDEVYRISSEPTIAKINMAQRWLGMQEAAAALQPTVIDLAASPTA